MLLAVSLGKPWLMTHSRIDGAVSLPVITVACEKCSCWVSCKWQVLGLKKRRCESNRKFKEETAVSQSAFELHLGRNDSTCWLLSSLVWFAAVLADGERW